MPEYLCKEITADVIGIYLGVYRAVWDGQREHEPPKLARDLMNALGQRGRETVEIPGARHRAVSARTGQSLFLVNGEVLVLVLKVVRLDDRQRESLEKLIRKSNCVVGLALNFGSRTPEFWRAQQDGALPKGIQT